MSLVDELFKYPSDSPVGTFSYDDNLTRLPLPSLDKTLSNYYNSLIPLATKSELESAKTIIDDFKNGIGKKLDAMLQKRASKEKNWLHEYWDKYAYLSNRYPLLPFCNMFGHSSLTDLYQPSMDIALKLTVVDVYYLIDFWRLLRSERLRTVQSTNPSSIYSSAQFRRLFNTVRIPGVEFDSLISYFKTEKEGPCPSHIIIMRGGRIFKVNVNINGKPIKASQLEQVIVDIKTMCKEKSEQEIGYMTCDERTSWAKNRQHLQSLSQKNKNILQFIEESIFIICLDPYAPQDTTETCQLTLCNNYSTRWADKSFSVMYFENGYIGGVCDHTAFDGVISGFVSYYVYSKIQENGLDWYQTEREDKIEPTELIFDLDEKISKEIIRLQVNLKQNQSSVTIISEAFTGFGKNHLKALKVHPDAFIQMALQLTYYKLHGKVCATYETATTRNYYNGRTETVRSCTEEALKWVTTMCNPKENTKTKSESLHTALSRHIHLMNEGKKNAGCDRHLFGLYCIALENNIAIPDLYTDELYSRRQIYLVMVWNNNLSCSIFLNSF
uniref:Putative carnitine o-acyltransferase cpti n=1 Tax=Xenopsylla cheopis TaxID=163159 RepID=A0A6M2DPT8_XENCH